MIQSVMKKFYYYDGKSQQGPFDIEELKLKGITKETMVWHEGLPEWKVANDIEELRDVFKMSTPPPIGINKQPPSTSDIPNPDPMVVHNVAKYKKRRSYWQIVLVVIVVSFGIKVLVALVNSGGDSDSGKETYQEKVMTIEEIERSQPTKFLIASGNYNENFWGTKYEIHGTIKNTATVATYKDAVIKVKYYSKTETEMGSNSYTLYEVFTPQSTVNFEVKVEKYEGVNTIGWEVVQATAN